MFETGSVMIKAACDGDLINHVDGHANFLAKVARTITLEEANHLYEKYGD